MMGKNGAKRQKKKAPPPLTVEIEGGFRVDVVGERVKHLAMADRLAASSNWRDRVKARVIVQDVGRQLAEKVEASAVVVGIDESIAAELARGGEVERSSPGGPVRMKDRDGLFSLFRCGRLTQRQYDAGLIYRRLTETAFAGGKSQLAERTGGGAASSDGIVWGGLQKAKAAVQRSKIDRAVALELRDEPACLATLRAVAGEGQALRTMVKGRAFERYAAALARALDLVPKVLKRGD